MNGDHQALIFRLLDKMRSEALRSGVVFAFIGLALFALVPILGRTESFRGNSSLAQLTGLVFLVGLFALPCLIYGLWKLRRSRRIKRRSHPIARALTTEPQLIAAVYNVRDEYPKERIDGSNASQTKESTGSDSSGQWVGEIIAGIIDPNPGYDRSTMHAVQSGMDPFYSSDIQPSGTLVVVLTDGNKHHLRSLTTTSALLEAIRAHAPHARTAP